ncbi:MAG: hypothetical protein ACLP7Q_16120 [Isosphaeraceae bacterium]
MSLIRAFADFEMEALRERTKGGLKTARRDERVGGRRPKLKPEQQKEIVQMVMKGKKTADEAARLFRVHPAAISRLLGRARQDSLTTKP